MNGLGLGGWVWLWVEKVGGAVAGRVGWGLGGVLGFDRLCGFLIFLLVVLTPIFEIELLYG